jgi:hypothetical protein
LRCKPVIHSYIKGVLDEHVYVSDTFLLTKDTSMYLAGKALDAISLDRKTFQRDRTWVFKDIGPFLIHTTEIIAALFRLLRTTGKGRDKYIPPCAYKTHRISSISGWYEPLSLDGSSSLDAGAGADAGAGS